MVSVPHQTRLGNFHMVRIIGRGASSEVWMARHVQIHDHVMAVKLLMSHEPELIERFQREAHIAARLHHPHIVQFYDFGQTPPLFYAVMEYIQGLSLREVIERRGALPLTEAVHIFKQIAGALDYAHSLRIVHRDVSPGNILIEETTRRAVLTDFGIARDAIHPITVSNAIMGTPYYLSPEHLDSATRVTHLSDLFCLGIIFYQLLCGQVPWVQSGRNPEQPDFNTLIPLSERGIEGIPRGMDEVLGTLLAHDPTQRFGSGSAAVHALEQLLKRHETETQVLNIGMLPAESLVELEASGVEPNVVEQVLGNELKRPVLERAHRRANELMNEVVVKALLDHWSAQDRLRGRPLLGRLARMHRIASHNVYFYQLQVLYERRVAGEDEEEPDLVGEAFPLEREIERWKVTLDAPQTFADHAGERRTLPGSTRVINCPNCKSRGLLVCKRCQGKQRIYIPRPTTTPSSAQGTAAGSSASGTGTTTTPEPQQILISCPDCDGRGSLTCPQCEGATRLIQRKTFHWSRNARRFDAQDDLPLVDETWLARTCQAEPIYQQRQAGGFHSTWQLIEPVAEIMHQAEAQLDTDTRIVLSELSISLIPVTDVLFDLGNTDEDSLYRLSIYGFENLIPPDWRFFNWERVIYLLFIVILVLLMGVFAFFALI
ncbi:hypothetical protein A9Q02_18660 [Candidatus Chloroploca asiatica]|uniref:non-specific serine/threonine protein kinase n=2 Tax=Candidatus Chloroploca asiatica TaxID=1506545 RepID=A0A2H3L2K3_9CHLR|nr:hypothetical protein A9Q02_18660 [Candidatus Chloroploca asiatica]